MTDRIKIKGGDYKWTDTGDGYFIVHDVPLVSEWKKGDHGATYDGTKETLDEFVATAQTRYRQGSFCATAYKRHNPDIPIDHPDFLGFALPNRVGKYALESGEKWTIFGDVKLSRDAFDQAKAGKIPYVSVEIPWGKRRIRGLSFQDTLPPQYEYALFTVAAEGKTDATAKFTAVVDEEAKMTEDAKSKAPESDDAKIHGAVAKYMASYMENEFPKHLKGALAKLSSDNIGKKPDAMPVETTTSKEGVKMSVDPEFAAKFAAQSQEVAEIKAKLVAQENAEKAKGLVAKAESSLSRKVISSALRDQIGQFASDAVSKQDGEAWFDKFVESLKTSLREKPPSSMAEFAASSLPAVEPGDTVVGKFAKEGPDAMEQVARFAAQWRQIKDSLGDRYQCSEENFIANELSLWKAKHVEPMNGMRR